MAVRNTDWVVGLVLYTGDQTKILLNSGPTPYKRSRIERMMNKQVLLSFLFVFVSSFIVALVGGLRYAKPEQRWSAYVDTSMSTGLYGFALFWSAMIMLQNVIPIALYVSIEFVKSWHVYWISQDINMYYAPTNKRCEARNWNISDDLGQVSYIFSDKTGTLTRNIMDFRMCSINGIIYGKQLPGDELDVVKGRMAQEEVDRNNPPEGGANPFFMEIQDEDNAGQYTMPPNEATVGAIGRSSNSSSLISTGTSQYDSSPLISTADTSLGRTRDERFVPPARNVPQLAPIIPVPATRKHTTQQRSEEETQAKRQQMIHVYLSAMRNVLEPKYIEIGNEETGEGGSYTFVDPQLFYDMRPEMAPSSAIKGLASPSQGLAPPEPIRRIGSHRSISNGYE
ncbi:phospholipid transporting ATPase, partial [Coemansia sp. RSA 921]